MRKLILLQLLLIAVAGCKPDEPLPEPKKPVAGKSVFVLNEGTFQHGNASLSLINTDSGSVVEDIFRQINNRPLGDVLQSIAIVNNEGWLVVNNSQKIERVNLETMQAGAPLTGLHSPRFVLQVNDQKVFVTDIYSNTIHVLNAANGQLMSDISCPGWTEQLIKVNNEVWVCNVRTNKVYVIDSGTNVIIDSVAVGDAPKDIRKDIQGRLWVLCEGKIPPGETAGSIYVINPSDRSVVRSMTAGTTTQHLSRLQINSDGDRLYFLNNGVMQMSINDVAFPNSAFIPAGGRLYYGLGIHPTDESIWVSDAMDYVQKGRVYRYSSGGQEVGFFNVGVSPGGFYFY